MPAPRGIATEAYNVATSGADYGYDGAGWLANYEGALPGLNSTFPAYMPKYSNYTFNANGNVTARPGQSLVWDVQNRAQGAPAQVTGGTIETYLYDPDGQRVKKTVGSTVSLYPFAHYEITGSTVTKYYFFAGMRIAMKQGSTLTYLHADHLGSTVLETNTAGTVTADQKYRAYGKQRDTGAVVTDHKFTGQKLDGTGLQYYNARYYDPAIGVFISPDTIVPDATNVFDYNRYMYVRGNPFKYTDPTGHQAACTMDEKTNWSCNDNAVTGGETQEIDPTTDTHSNNPNGTRQFLTTMATVGVASFGAGFITPYLASLWPAAVQGSTATASAACADGDCTNEVASLAPRVQNAINSINWLEGQSQRVEHIMAPKHEWSRLTELTGNIMDDYRAVQPFIQQTVDAGTKSVINQSTAGAVVQFSHTVNEQQVVVRALQTAQNAFQMTDAWVVK